MSSLSSLDGVRRVFKELSDSLESAQGELSELRKANYMLRTEVEYLRAIKDKDAEIIEELNEIVSILHRGGPHE